MPTRSSCARRARPTSRRRSGPSCASTTAGRPTCSNRSRAGSGSGATRSWASGPRRLLEVRDGLARIQTRPVTVPVYAPDLPVETLPAADPLAAIRAFVPRRRVEPTEGMPRFTGGAVGALAYDAISSFEPSVPLPDRDPVDVPIAAFIETDLVLVFDHLTHTLSAIASLHTETPDLEGRYRIAEAAIFEALERTARPSGAELNGRRRASRGTERPRPGARRARSRPASVARSTSTPSRWPRTPSPPARRSRSCWPGASRSSCRRTRRPAPTLDGIGLYRALRRVNPSPYLFFVRTPALRGRRRLAGAAPPGRGRPADHPPDRRDPAARRRRPGGRPPLRGAPARPEGTGRARHARRPRSQRPGSGRPARHGHGQQVHGGRALQPRPPPRSATSRAGSGRSSTRSTRCGRSFRPGRCPARPRSGRCS